MHSIVHDWIQVLHFSPREPLTVESQRWIVFHKAIQLGSVLFDIFVVHGVVDFQFRSLRCSLAS